MNKMNKMNITIEDLKVAVEEATVKMKVLAPSTDYYARPGDSDTETITYVSAPALIAALDKLIEEKQDGQ